MREVPLANFTSLTKLSQGLEYASQSCLISKTSLGSFLIYNVLLDSVALAAKQHGHLLVEQNTMQTECLANCLGMNTDTWGFPF